MAMFLVVIVLAYNDNGLGANAEIIVSLIMRVDTQTVQIILRPAKKSHLHTSYDGRSPGGADRVPPVGHVNGVWLGLLAGHRHHTLFLVVFLEYGYADLPEMIPLPQIEDCGIRHIVLGQGQSNPHCIPSASATLYSYIVQRDFVAGLLVVRNGAEADVQSQQSGNQRAVCLTVKISNHIIHFLPRSCSAGHDQGVLFGCCTKLLFSVVSIFTR